MKGQLTSGERIHLVTLAAPGVPVPDGQGGYTETPAPLDPAEWWVSIVPATARNLERLVAGTVVASASHIVAGPYHQGITTKTVITFGARTFSVVGVTNPGEQNIDTVCQCVEAVQ